MKKLGLIGFGNFGRFAAEHLGEDFEILAYDPQMTQEINSNVKSVSLDEAASQPLVLLCVPLQNLPSVLEQIKPNVRPGALVVDTCSVKIKPSKAMEESIPEGVQIIGTHPLFGPQSGKNGLKGLDVVVCPVRAEEKTVEKLETFLKTKGLNVLHMTPKAHDEWMARTQAVAHLIGRAAKEMNLEKAPFRLATYDALLTLRDLVNDDSDALFQTIQLENPFAKMERKRFFDQMEKVEKALMKK